MNESQKTTLVTVVTVCIALLFVPPYYSGQERLGFFSSGHKWIFELSAGESVDIGLLITQWIGVLIAGAIAFFALKDR